MNENNTQNKRNNQESKIIILLHCTQHCSHSASKNKYLLVDYYQRNKIRNIIGYLQYIQNLAICIVFSLRSDTNAGWRVYTIIYHLIWRILQTKRNRFNRYLTNLNGSIILATKRWWHLHNRPVRYIFFMYILYYVFIAEKLVMCNNILLFYYYKVQTVIVTKPLPAERSDSSNSCHTTAAPVYNSSMIIIILWHKFLCALKVYIIIAKHTWLRWSVWWKMLIHTHLVWLRLSASGP